MWIQESTIRRKRKFTCLNGETSYFRTYKQREKLVLTFFWQVWSWRAEGKGRNKTSLKIIFTRVTYYILHAKAAKAPVKVRLKLEIRSISHSCTNGSLGLWRRHTLGRRRVLLSICLFLSTFAWRRGEGSIENFEKIVWHHLCELRGCSQT